MSRTKKTKRDSWGEVKFWTKFPEGPRKDAIYAPKVTFQKGTEIYKSVYWLSLIHIFVGYGIVPTECEVWI